MKIITPLFLIAAISLSLNSFSQSSDSSLAISFSAYADAYIAWYNDSLGLNDYQKFPSVSPRSKQFGLNVAQASFKLTSRKVRSTVTIHYGDIPRSTWSSTFNPVQEANVGFRICPKFWIDGGFFRTHVGTEGLFPKENITSSVAIPTYFEPYYEAGIKFTYTPSDKAVLNFYLLNGYNVFEDNNKKKSAGLLFTYAINDHLGIGYDNYLGDETPDADTIDHLRFYNNVFLNYEKGKVKIVTGIDFAVQANSSVDEPDKAASLFSGVFNIRYKATKQLNIYGRAEAYTDPDGFLSGVFEDDENNMTGLKLVGVTLGGEFKPTDNSYIRIEGRNLIANGAQKIFYRDGELKRSRFETMLNFGVWFP